VSFASGFVSGVAATFLGSGLFLYFFRDRIVQYLFARYAVNPLQEMFNGGEIE